MHADGDCGGMNRCLTPTLVSTEAVGDDYGMKEGNIARG